MDEFHVGDANEPQDLADETRLGVLFLVNAATGDENIGFFTLDQALGPCLGVAEGDTGARDMVEIGMQYRGYVEVVHGYTENNHIGAVQFFDQGVRVGDNLALGLGYLGGRGGECLESRQAEVWNRVFSQVAADDFPAGVLCLPALGETIGEGRRLSVPVEQAALNLQ